MPNELSTRIDRDKLHMISRDQVAHVAHALLHGGHNERGEMLVAATAVLFAVICERGGDFFPSISLIALRN